MPYLLNDCRAGKQLNSAQIMECLADELPEHTTISFTASRVTVVASGKVFSAPIVEKALAAAADGLSLT